jgi:hypothetical protein
MAQVAGVKCRMCNEYIHGPHHVSRAIRSERVLTASNSQTANDAHWHDKCLLCCKCGVPLWGGAYTYRELRGEARVRDS